MRTRSQRPLRQVAHWHMLISHLILVMNCAGRFLCAKQSQSGAGQSGSNIFSPRQPGAMAARWRASTLNTHASLLSLTDSFPGISIISPYSWGSLLSSMHPFTYWVGRIISKVLALLQEITIFKDNTFQNLDLNWKFQFSWLHIYELKGEMREQNIS
jgi:hypothetical protein